MREVELKAVTPDPDALVARLRAAGAAPVLEGMLRDARYDDRAGTLLARDHVLRLRSFAGAGSVHATLDWKGPTTHADGYKVREELSTTAGDADALAQILARLGYVVIREIDRHIAQFACRGASVRVERYPRMDALVEVEGEPAAIEQAIADTGLARTEFTPERLADFVARYEARTGQRAALCDRELTGDYPYAANA